MIEEEQKMVVKKKSQRESTEVNGSQRERIIIIMEYRAHRSLCMLTSC